MEFSRLVSRLILVAAATLAFTGLASAAPDRTDTILAEFKKSGLTELGSFEIGALKLRLSISKGAETIISTKNFDLPDTAFDQEKFNAFVVERFTTALTYFQALVAKPGISEFHVIIDDLGENRKGTISETRVFSRVITSDVRRWHKFFRGKNSFLADLTAIHEFTHVINYVLDDGEVKLHRELVAIVFESLNLIRMHDEATYKSNYLKKVAGTLSKPEQVLSNTYVSNTPLRYLAHSFISKVLEGSYGVTGDRLKTLQEFAFLYLADRAAGSLGFESALGQLKITDRAGAKLTFLQVQKDLHAELTKPL